MCVCQHGGARGTLSSGGNLQEPVLISSPHPHARQQHPDRQLTCVAVTPVQSVCAGPSKPDGHKRGAHWPLVEWSQERATW